MYHLYPLDDDFNTTRFEFPISAHTTVLTLPEYVINVADDEINEREEVFVLVAEIGSDVPNESACFQERHGTDCTADGRRGVATIRIIDNDRKQINFNLKVTDSAMHV